jgi:hypothetical protein
MNVPQNDILALDRVLPAGTILVHSCRRLSSDAKPSKIQSDGWLEWTPGVFLQLDDNKPLGKNEDSVGDHQPPPLKKLKRSGKQQALSSSKPVSLLAAVDFLARYSFIRATYKHSDVPRTADPSSSTFDAPRDLVIRIYVVPIDLPGFRTTVLSRRPGLRSKEVVPKSKRMLLRLFSTLDSSPDVWSGTAIPTSSSYSSSPPSLYEIFNSLESPRPDQDIYQGLDDNIVELLEAALSPSPPAGMKTVLYNYQRVSQPNLTCSDRHLILIPNL